MPSDLAPNLRNLSREYYNLVDNSSAYINKLQGELRMVFPQYLKFFSKITVNTALTLLEKYTSPDVFLSTSKDEVIASIRPTARIGIVYAKKSIMQLFRMQAMQRLLVILYAVILSSYYYTSVLSDNMMKKSQLYFLICMKL